MSNNTLPNCASSCTDSHASNRLDFSATVLSSSSWCGTLISWCRVPMVLVSLLFFVSACATSPGMNAKHLRAGKFQQASELSSDDPASTFSPVFHTINARLIVSLEAQAATARAIALQREQQSQLQVSRGAFEYRVGPSDVLSITVWDHPELTIPAGSERNPEAAGNLVSYDGTIFFPYAGVVKVAGKSLPEIREMLTKKLSRFIVDVKVDVRVAGFNSQRVYIVGEVKTPSVRTIRSVPPTIIEMISQSGGVTNEADRKNITVNRAGKIYPVDLMALYEQGDRKQNILLEAGDVVNIPDRKNHKVFVLGEVLEPGSFQINKHRKSLAEALSEAGGVSQETSDPSQIFVVRGSGERPAVFHLDGSTPEALILADRFKLKSRDVIYVDAAKIVRWNRVVRNISSTLSTLNSASSTDFPLFKGSDN